MIDINYKQLNIHNMTTIKVNIYSDLMDCVDMGDGLATNHSEYHTNITKEVIKEKVKEIKNNYYDVEVIVVDRRKNL